MTVKWTIGNEGTRFTLAIAIVLWSDLRKETACASYYIYENIHGVESIMVKLDGKNPGLGM
jgi:hypothetical protein